MSWLLACARLVRIDYQDGKDDRPHICSRCAQKSARMGNHATNGLVRHSSEGRCQYMKVHVHGKNIRSISELDPECNHWFKVSRKAMKLRSIEHYRDM